MLLTASANAAPRLSQLLEVLLTGHNTAPHPSISRC